MTSILINMNAGCNVDCIYCKRNKFVKENKVKQMTFEEFKKQIDSEEGITSESQIMFSGGGEPTCHNELPMFMFYSKKMGFKKISIETNAIKLSNEKYLELLINSGLNSCVISIPSLDEKTYEKILDSKGSFVLLKKALKNIIERKIPINDVLITLTKYNYKELIPLIKGLKRYTNRFSLFHARPNYTTLYEKDIIIRYSELQKYLYDVFEYCDNNKIEISNGTGAGAIPLCFMGKYLGKSSFYIQIKQNLKPERHDETLTYTKVCENCKLKEYCPGIAKNYIILFGDKEFKPILV